MTDKPELQCCLGLSADDCADVTGRHCTGLERPTPEPQPPVGDGGDAPAIVWQTYPWCFGPDKTCDTDISYTRTDLVTAMQLRHAEELERAVKEAREVAFSEALSGCNDYIESHRDEAKKHGIDQYRAVCIAAANRCMDIIRALKGKTDE